MILQLPEPVPGVLSSYLLSFQEAYARYKKALEEKKLQWTGYAETKLTEKEIFHIKMSKDSAATLAELYGVSKSHIQRVRRRG